MVELLLTSVVPTLQQRYLFLSKILVGFFGKGIPLIMINNCILPSLFPVAGSMNANGECYVGIKNTKNNLKQGEQGTQEHGHQRGE